ncbi:MAG TPA: glycosyltransferase family 1 protein [Pyrinomonadaceae bacterium]
MKKLRIAINAQVMPDAGYGGIVTVLRALAALPELSGTSEEYVFVGPHENYDWIRSILPPGQTVVRGPKFMSPSIPTVDRAESFKRQLGSLRPLARGVKQFLAQLPTNVATRSVENKTAEHFDPRTARDFFQSLACDVIHFPFQAFEDCGLPSIYNPHDLQHFHLPQFFTDEEISRREKIYPMACRSAHTIVVASQMVKQDVVQRFGLQPGKVKVIPWAPPLLEGLPNELNENDLRDIIEKYELTGMPFVLYPAMTWEHKNHLRLLDAIALLRKREKLNFRVICTGFKTDFWPRIHEKLGELDLKQFVQFPGLVSLAELSALYRRAQFIFVPTLFEAMSAPVFEAWQHGVPVACSTVTSLPEQVDDAALLFDPYSVEAIAAALERLNTDPFLRHGLVQRGRHRLEQFSLERTARAYRAVYRSAAGQDLTEEDRELLRDNAMHKSRKVG